MIFLGSDSDENHGTSFEDRFDEGEIDKVRRAVRGCLERGEARFEASLLQKKGGKRRYVFICKRLDLGGESCVVGVGRDAAGSQPSGDAPSECESNYREIFNATSDAILIHDAVTGEIVDVNKATLDVWRLSRDEALRLTVVDLSEGDSRTVQRDAFRWMRKAAEEGPQLFEWLARRSDGTPFWIEVALRKTEIGGKGRLLAVARDISERKRMEEAVRESAERFQTQKAAEHELRLISLAAKQSHEGLAVVDVEGDVLFVNDAFAKMHGWDPEELPGRHLSLFHAPEHMPSVNAANRQVRETGKFTGEVWHSRKDGTAFLALMHSSLVHDESGRPCYIVGSCAEITERKRADEQLRQLQSELAHSGRLNMLGELASGLAHELNQPLICLNMYAQTCSRLIASGAADLSIIREPLAEISREVDRATTIVRRLRTFGRKRPMHRSTVDVSGLVREVAVLIEHEARNKEVRLYFELADGLPLVLADSIQIQQVVLNLILNGIQAIDEDGATVREITIKTEKTAEEGVRLSVRDSGPGLPPEDLERIFEPFYSTKPNGMGLGLSISRTIIEDHHGRMSAVSKPERGGEFSFTLPNHFVEPQNDD